MVCDSILQWRMMVSPHIKQLNYETLGKQIQSENQLKNYKDSE